jgi:hypothetical protein
MADAVPSLASGLSIGSPLIRRYNTSPAPSQARA